jgi:hypothetical protein
VTPGFGQIYPLKKSVGGKDVILKSFFYYNIRERESEFTRGNACNIFSIMWIILTWIGERCQEEKYVFLNL